MNPTDQSTDDPRVLHATQEYLTELEAGCHPERGAFLARYPEVRAELGPFLDALDLFHVAGPIGPPARAPPSIRAPMFTPSARPSTSC